MATHFERRASDGKLVAKSPLAAWQKVGEEDSFVGLTYNEAKEYRKFTTDPALLLVIKLLERGVVDPVTVFDKPPRPVLERKLDDLKTDMGRVRILYPNVTDAELIKACQVVETFYREVEGWWETSLSGFALFLQFSRLGHSCSPNCILLFDSKKAHLFALRPIASGELLTVSLCGPVALHPYAVRQQRLRTLLGGDCICSLCVAESKTDSKAVAASDPSILSNMKTAEEWKSVSAGRLAVFQRLLPLHAKHGLVGMAHLTQTAPSAWVQRWVQLLRKLLPRILADATIRSHCPDQFLVFWSVWCWTLREAEELGLPVPDMAKSEIDAATVQNLLKLTDTEWNAGDRRKWTATFINTAYDLEQDRYFWTPDAKQPSKTMGKFRDPEDDPSEDEDDEYVYEGEDPDDDDEDPDDDDGDLDGLMARQFVLHDGSDGPSKLEPKNKTEADKKAEAPSLPKPRGVILTDAELKRVQDAKKDETLFIVEDKRNITKTLMHMPKWSADAKDPSGFNSNRLTNATVQFNAVRAEWTVVTHPRKT